MKQGITSQAELRRMDSTQKVLVSQGQPRSLLRDFACLRDRSHRINGFYGKLCKSADHLKTENGLIHLQYGGLPYPQEKVREK